MEMCYDGTLVLPSNYAVMDDEEMMYLEGGAFYSKTQCLNVLGAVGVNPGTYITVAMSYTLAKIVIKKAAACFGGLAGWAVGTILAYAGSQIITFGKALARGAVNKGVNISWNWNIKRDSIGVTYSVKY